MMFVGVISAIECYFDGLASYEHGMGQCECRYAHDTDYNRSREIAISVGQIITSLWISANGPG